MSEGLLVEIDITDLVWDERTDGTYEYAVDRIDWFIELETYQKNNCFERYLISDGDFDL